MKVILQQDVRGQGKKGELIEASEGYARNYLLPRKLGSRRRPTRSTP
jgi:large subunit ribosomal protein L9